MKPRIKVLHILEAVAGGTRKVVNLQLRNLNSEEFDVSLCLPPPSTIAKARRGELNDPQFGESLKKDGFRIFEIAMLSEQLISITNLIAIVKLFVLLKKHRFDVVHCSSSIAGFLGRISAKVARVPVIIYSPHGFSFFQYLSKTKYLFYLLLEKTAGLLTDTFIVSSIHEKEEALKVNLAKHGGILILENPIELEKYRLSKKSGLSGKNIKCVVGMVARLVPQKMPSDFIYMAHHLNMINPNVDFVLVGDGRLNSEVKELISELAISNISLLSNRTDYLEIMSTFDVFVMTSLWEGLPYAPIEALLLGIPTVLTDVSGVRDLLEKHAPDWIVPVRSPKLSAHVVNNILLNYDTEKQKVLAIQKIIIDRFDAKKIGKQLGDCYKKLINEK